MRPSSPFVTHTVHEVRLPLNNNSNQRRRANRAPTFQPFLFPTRERPNHRTRLPLRHQQGQVTPHFETSVPPAHPDRLKKIESVIERLRRRARLAAAARMEEEGNSQAAPRHQELAVTRLPQEVQLIRPLPLHMLEHLELARERPPPSIQG